MTRTVDQAGDDQGAQHDHRHGERQRQQTAHPGHGRAQDEGEEHGDRRRDQHVPAEIERDDRHRADEGDGGGAKQTGAAAGRGRKIGEFHGLVDQAVSEVQPVDRRGGVLETGDVLVALALHGRDSRAPRRSRTDLIR